MIRPLLPIGLIVFGFGTIAAAQSGEQLARQYCASCHVLPEPASLTKVQWMHHIMPKMAIWLGIEPPNYEDMQDGRTLQQTRIFPEQPMLSQKEWFAIWDYYKAGAPQEHDTPKRESQLPITKLFRARKINFQGGAPMVSLVKIDNGKLYVGEAVANSLMRMDGAGKVLERLRLSSPPVALNRASNGFVATLIGRIFPSDANEGAAVRLGSERPPLLGGLRRPTDVRAGDLNSDGKEDLAVCEFGNRLGRFTLQFGLGNDEYDEHVLLDRPGAIRSEIVDVNGDRMLDVVVLTAQAREGLFTYFNQGQGKFRVETVVEFPPTYGVVDFQVLDFNKDGKLDFMVVNGDNGDFPTPRKPYHGVRVYLNDGTNLWKESWFGALDGAYKAMPADYDQDGDVDIAAICFYPDFSKGKEVLGFVYLENKGDMKFNAHTLPERAAGRWMVMDAGDLDADGDMDVVLGSFVRGPTTIPVPQELEQHWRTQGAALLVLENTTR